MPTYLTPGVFIEEPAFRPEPVEGVSMVTVEFVARMLSQSPAYRKLARDEQRAIAADTARLWAALGTNYFHGRLLSEDDFDDEQEFHDEKEFERPPAQDGYQAAD